MWVEVTIMEPWCTTLDKPTYEVIILRLSSIQSMRDPRTVQVALTTKNIYITFYYKILNKTLCIKRHV